jgi:predicted nucleic acid-binding protein
MTDLVFVDTNVVIYTRDREEPEKARQAIAWIRLLRDADRLIVSPQVVNEAYSVSLWKFESVGRASIRSWLANYLPFCRAPLDANVILAAFEIERDFSVSWWDALILASAVAANCRYVLSEDMQHRQIVRTTRVMNPFQTTPTELRIGP